MDRHPLEDSFLLLESTLLHDASSLTESNLPDVYGSVESEVRSYCRAWPTTLATARGSWVTDTEGRTFLDMFAGAGALNYGHNNPILKSALLDYLAADGIVHSLDIATTAKQRFLEAFDRLILTPRGLDYKVQFPGPTGTNAVEAALKLARKVTGRESIISFTNAFHGMTLGSLSVTGNSMKRAGAGIPLVHATPMPYDNYFGGVTEDFHWFERVLDDSGSGLNRPAAVIVETVQGEGGLNVARLEWLQELAALCRKREILLIVDDVQMGCGRTGGFFSFEAAGIVPDIVTLSKSISGYGLPMALTLLRRDLDVWSPGEHNGTFRGHNPAFITATKALETFWKDEKFAQETTAKGDLVRERLDRIATAHDGVSARGRGMAQGLRFDDAGRAERVRRAVFERGALMETSGPSDEVVKLLPPLTTSTEDLDSGLAILAESVAATA
ncbi:MAG: diaminobutyrate--2-oxoglutarate transaminase [Mycolicibacterium neoaurum]|uniref:diaminobutyrate--2-oxoglutarate transaminase n=1 Tax=Mycolicibacterium neoaurum TaxID=1795 RepID=UPI002FF744E8